MAYLKFNTPIGHRFFKLPEDRTAIFGREVYCEFQLRMEADVSREHFSIGPDDNGAYILVDLGSRNGTFLNGSKLGNDTVTLKEGDEIRAGTQKLYFFKNLPENAKLGEPSKVQTSPSP